MIIDNLIAINKFEGGVVLATLLSQDDGQLKFEWGTRVSEHRINPRLVNALQRALDLTLEDSSASCLIVTGEGKFFSNGMDLLWIDQNPEETNSHQQSTELLMSRLLSFPIPTIAAINGHFCAAGAMLGLCFDYRIMPMERALFFVPAVDLGLVYSTGMVELMRCKTPQVMHRDMILISKRYRGLELLDLGVVDQVVEGKDPGEVKQRSIEFATDRLLKPQGKFLGAKYRHALGETKEKLYAKALQSLRVDLEPMGFEDGTWDKHGRSKL